MIPRLLDRRVTSSLALVTGLAACGTSASTERSASPGPPPAVAVAAPSALEASMRRHFEEVRQVELALIFGQLDAARQHARGLATMAEDANLRSDSLARVRAAAAQIADAPNIEHAFPHLAALAGECARCHEASSAVVKLPPIAEPAEDGSAASRMARHQWAADRIWEGLVAPSETRWREGLAVLAEEPLPVEGLTDDRDVYPITDKLGNELAQHARGAAAARLPAERADAFDAMLETCAACHALIRH